MEKLNVKLGLFSDIKFLTSLPSITQSVLLLFIYFCFCCKLTRAMWTHTGAILFTLNISSWIPTLQNEIFLVMCLIQSQVYYNESRLM
jgi:hypothetical protein